MVFSQVECARADRRGVRIAVDFAGSTNLVILPTAGFTSSRYSGTTVPATRLAARDDGEAQLEQMPLALLSAEVAVQAFCRTLLARVTMRDPAVAGTIKASASKRRRRERVDHIRSLLEQSHRIASRFQMQPCSLNFPSPLLRGSASNRTFSDC